MKWELFIPSYGRPAQQPTAQYFPEAHIVVPESQREDYEQNYPGRVLTIKDERDGNIARKRNACIDLALERGNKGLVMIDDDFVSVQSTLSNQLLMDWEFMGLLHNAFHVAQGFGAHLFGFSADVQPLHQEVNLPFSLGRFFYTVTGLLITELRYDESLDRQSDMDFWLQHVHRDSRALRFNHFSLTCKMKDEKQTGGIESKEESLADSKKLLTKWGSDVLNWDQKRGVFLTPKSPYKGI